jgi:hypothetical protein
MKIKGADNRPCPEAALTGSRFCACPAFSRAFFLVVVTGLPNVTQGHLIPSGFSLVYGTGSCATSVMTEGHINRTFALQGWFEKPKNRLFGKILAFWICNKCTLSKVEVRHNLYRQYMKITWRWWMNDKITWRHARIIPTLFLRLFHWMSINLGQFVFYCFMTAVLHKAYK